MKWKCKFIFEDGEFMITEGEGSIETWVANYTAHFPLGKIVKKELLELEVD